MQFDPGGSVFLWNPLFATVDVESLLKVGGFADVVGSIAKLKDINALGLGGIHNSLYSKKGFEGGVELISRG